MAKKHEDDQLPGTEVEPWQPIEPSFALILAKYDVPVVSTPEEVAMAMAERILSADTFAGTLDQSGTVQARDLIGEDVGIVGFHFMRSTVEGDGPGVYAVLDAVYRGKSTAITTGARTCLIQLIKWQHDHMLPVVVSICQGDRTRAGFRPMWFGPPSQVGADGPKTTEEAF